jgi:hypothetical protein
MQVKNLIEEIDMDGDGMVDVEEFVTMVIKEVHKLVSGNPDTELATQESRHRDLLLVSPPPACILRDICSI